MNKLKNWYESLEPENQSKLIRWTVFPLLFILLITPSITWLFLPDKYNSKHDWLQDFAWIFPLTIVGAGFITTVVWMIFNYIRDTKK